MNKLIELMMAVNSGEVDVTELTEQEQDVVLEGYRELADRLLENPEFAEFASKIAEVIDLATANPFENEIQEAEQRGSTYWEIESDHVH
jgi:hypothetical protein